MSPVTEGFSLLDAYYNNNYRDNDNRHNINRDNNNRDSEFQLCSILLKMCEIQKKTYV